MFEIIYCKLDKVKLYIQTEKHGDVNDYCAVIFIMLSAKKK